MVMDVSIGNMGFMALSTSMSPMRGMELRTDDPEGLAVEQEGGVVGDEGFGGRWHSVLETPKARSSNRSMARIDNADLADATAETAGKLRSIIAA